MCHFYQSWIFIYSKRLKKALCILKNCHYQHFINECGASFSDVSWRPLKWRDGVLHVYTLSRHWQRAPPSYHCCIIMQHISKFSAIHLHSWPSLQRGRAITVNKLTLPSCCIQPVLTIPCVCVQSSSLNPSRYMFHSHLSGCYTIIMSKIWDVIFAHQVSTLSYIPPSKYCSLEVYIKATLHFMSSRLSQSGFVFCLLLFQWFF